ncbi:GIY-YIG nuclease family protein [Epilithonimonas xixisoli]|uniref:T5orf172 domain-containing protein n=1 Tax=Epilithonimonas xixisoli TaxID=1476462 RepID=A0A4R8I9D8_9FLAO|nr:GIY-YIG nuclease family protein [Epilithonimonas xixisoli]TDX83272.1 T5orf172 domain-containing protein [Epilithonimonas xixisoli]
MRINFTNQNHKEIIELYAIKDEEEERASQTFTMNLTYGIIPRYLYLMKIQNENIYKIGITNNLNKRQSELQTGNPYFINIVFAVEADLTDYFGREIIYLEKFLHKNYYERKIHREWYSLTKMDVCKIFLFLTTSIYARELPDIIPGTGLLEDVLENCRK